MKLHIHSKAQRNIEHELYVILFVIFYLSSAFGNVFSNNATLLLYGVLGCSILCFSGMHFFLRKNELTIIILILSNVLLTTIISGDGIKQLILWAVYLFVAISLVVSYPAEKIMKAFVRLLYFLCVCSLALWTTFMLAPSLVSWLPRVSNNVGYSAYTMFVASIYRAGNVGIARNQGMFWEPGAYQTFINIAMLLCLFSRDDEIKKRKYIIVFVVTIITTFSTAGYVVMSGVIITYVAYEMIRQRGGAGKSLKLLLVLSVCTFAFFLLYENLPPLVKYQLFGKLNAFFDGSKSSQASSTGIRVNSILISMRAFFENPILGCGLRGMENIALSFGSSVGTCTPVNWFAYFGFIMGLIMNLGLYRFTRLFRTNGFIRAMLFLVILLSISSENYWRNPSILMFVFMGYHGRMNVEDIRN